MKNKELTDKGIDKLNNTPISEKEQEIKNLDVIPRTRPKCRIFIPTGGIIQIKDANTHEDFEFDDAK